MKKIKKTIYLKDINELKNYISNGLNEFINGNVNGLNITFLDNTKANVIVNTIK